MYCLPRAVKHTLCIVDFHLGNFRTLTQRLGLAISPFRLLSFIEGPRAEANTNLNKDMSWDKMACETVQKEPPFLHLIIITLVMAAKVIQARKNDYLATFSAPPLLKDVSIRGIYPLPEPQEPPSQKTVDEVELWWNACKTHLESARTKMRDREILLFSHHLETLLTCFASSITHVRFYQSRNRIH